MESDFIALSCRPMVKLFVQVLEERMRSNGCCHVLDLSAHYLQGGKHFFIVTISYYVTVSDKKKTQNLRSGMNKRGLVALEQSEMQDWGEKGRNTVLAGINL